MVRLLILRTLVIVGSPGTAFLFWLTNPATWRHEFRTSAGRLWRGETL